MLQKIEMLLTTKADMRSTFRHIFIYFFYTLSSVRICKLETVSKKYIFPIAKMCEERVRSWVECVTKLF